MSSWRPPTYFPRRKTLSRGVEFATSFGSLWGAGAWWWGPLAGPSLWPLRLLVAAAEGQADGEFFEFFFDFRRPPVWSGLFCCCCQVDQGQYGKLSLWELGREGPKAIGWGYGKSERVVSVKRFCKTVKVGAPNKAWDFGLWQRTRIKERLDSWGTLSAVRRPGARSRLYPLARPMSAHQALLGQQDAALGRRPRDRLE